MSLLSIVITIFVSCCFIYTAVTLEIGFDGGVYQFRVSEEESDRSS